MAAAPEITIRALRTDDRDAWFRLWQGYLSFYEKSLDPNISEATWQKLLAGKDVFGLVAADGTGKVIGIVNCVVHANTWSMQPVCYLEDLFVDSDVRGQGAGRALIDAVIARARMSGWLRVYWQTKASNAAARRLYDQVTPVTDWVRYDVATAATTTD